MTKPKDSSQISPKNPKRLTLVYLASNRALIGQLDKAKSDDYGIVLNAVAEVVDQSAILPNGSVAKQTFLIGIGMNMGPIKEVSVQTATTTHILECSPENLGPACYDRVERSYRDFLGFEQRDKVSKIQLPTTKQVADVADPSGKLHRVQ